MTTTENQIELDLIAKLSDLKYTYSLYEPREMLPENKEHLGRALRQFIDTHPFSPTLFGGA